MYKIRPYVCIERISYLRKHLASILLKLMQKKQKQKSNKKYRMTEEKGETFPFVHWIRIRGIPGCLLISLTTLDIRNPTILTPADISVRVLFISQVVLQNVPIESAIASYRHTLCISWLYSSRSLTLSPSSFRFIFFAFSFRNRYFWACYYS